MAASLYTTAAAGGSAPSHYQPPLPVKVNYVVEHAAPSALCLVRKVQSSPYQALPPEQLQSVTVPNILSLRPPPHVAHQAVMDFYFSINGHCGVQCPDPSSLDLISVAAHSRSTSAAASAPAPAPAPPYYHQATEGPVAAQVLPSEPSSVVGVSAVDAAMYAHPHQRHPQQPCNSLPSVLGTPILPPTAASSSSSEDYRLSQIRRNERHVNNALYGKVCAFFNTREGCRRGPYCNFLHIGKGGPGGGAVTGGSEALFTYPVEYVKTNLQLQQLASPTAATPHQYRGMWDCVKRTVQEYSPLGLYRGFIPVLLGSIPKQAFRWTAYEWATGRAKLMMMHGGNAQSERGVVTLSLPTVSACGFFAGCVEAVFVVGPTESVKTRLIQDAKQTCPRYRPLGTARAVRLMLQENGVRRTFYSGVGATMLKQGLNQALRFPTQEFVMDVICCSNTKNNIIGSRNGGSSPFAMRQHEERRHSPFWNGVAGFCAGFISVLVTQPVDVVKTHLQSGAAHNATAVHTCGIGKKPSCVGFFRCLRAIYCQRGVAGLYSGFIARSVHVGIHVALTFTVFPVVKRFFLTSAA